MTRKYVKGDQPSGGETTWTYTGATRYGRGQHKTGSFGDDMLRPSPNHGTQRLPNDDDDDHLGGVDVFHHDSPALSVSGHLWVDAIDAHVTFQSVKPSHLWTFSGPGSHHRHAQRASCYVDPSLRITCPYFDSRFWVRTDLIGVILAIPLIVSFLILSFLVFP